MPNQQLAKDLGLSISDLEKYYYDVCCLDYAKLREDNLVLLDTIKHTEKIEIKALNTNLSLSKKGIDAQIMCGEKNLPDGEIYTAPNKYSVNGKIKFNANSQQRGQLFKDIDLHFENGRVVNATSNNTSKLNEILDIDDGARYIGEFAFGINPKIYNPTGVILFDEKIAGSIHCALGQCYADACNGNNSALHWDLVQLHKANYGGGEIYFDEDLVCKDGEWKILQKVKK
jgi:aminopeptidase